jgi:O-antigen/teichoic acid export membrane protein
LQEKAIFTPREMRKAKLFEFAKLVSIVGSTQTILQVINIITGILIIRMLPTEEYAFYTIANTLLGTMVLLSDSGIGIGVMSEGGKVWQDQQKLGQVLNTGLQLRKTFGIVSLCIVIPILVYLLIHNKAGYFQTIIIIIALIPAFIASLSDSILEIVPRLHQDLKALQKNQVEVGIVRLLLSVISLFLFPLTIAALVANALPRILGNIKLRKIANKFVKIESETSNDIRNNMLKIVKRALPSGIYYCFIGQISVWVISIFGKTSSIAAIGALGRIAFVTNVLASVFSMIIIPRFARMPAEKGLLLRRYLFTLGILAVALFSIIFLTWAFSTRILMILGANYHSLDFELVLAVTSSSLGVLTGASINLITSRGWLLNPVFSILINMTALITGVLIFNLSTLKGVLLLGIFIALVEFAINFGFGSLKIARSYMGESNSNLAKANVESL